LAKRGPEFIDPRLAKALEHPTRVDILAALREGPSSPSRIQQQLQNVSLNLVSHHVKVLKDLECIELVETVRRRGATEHIYRTKVGPTMLNEEVWNEVAPKMRQPITASILRRVSADLAYSLGAGRFDEFSNSHLSRSALKLDRDGWSEVVDLLAGTLDDLFEIEARNLERLEASGETPLSVIVAIMQFPTADSEAEADPER
jgi:DNA-binding transcriptional ArsR family regulator